MRSPSHPPLPALSASIFVKSDAIFELVYDFEKFFVFILSGPPSAWSLQIGPEIKQILQHLRMFNPPSLHRLRFKFALSMKIEWFSLFGKYFLFPGPFPGRGLIKGLEINRARSFGCFTFDFGALRSPPNFG